MQELILAIAGLILEVLGIFFSGNLLKPVLKNEGGSNYGTGLGISSVFSGF